MVKGCKLTITGDLGSGKSTVAKYLIEKYGFNTFSTGAYQRQIAERMNMSTLELNEYAETHPEIDKDIDGKLTEVGQQDGDYIFDSRMAWHFVPQSYKVYVQCDLDVAATRIYNDATRGQVDTATTIEDAKQKIVDRRNSEERRYFAKYGVKILDMDNYDLVIDSTNSKPEEVAETIYTKMKEWYNGR